MFEKRGLDVVKPRAGKFQVTRRRWRREGERGAEMAKSCEVGRGERESGRERERAESILFHCVRFP